jgi:DNA polymerase I
MSYCESDVLETVELFKHMITVPDFHIPTALFRGEYMKSVAEIEYNGVPIDTDLLNQLQENWERMKSKLIKNIDEFGIYEGTTFKINNFERYIQANGWMWPRTDTGMPKTDKETFKEMAEIHPEIQPLRELKALIGGLNLKTIMAGSDDRSRTLISPSGLKQAEMPLRMTRRKRV